jgi:exonuclease SbcC
MPKIKSVRVWGFQSWVNGQYDLVDGLNVFTGPSGSGKTAGTIRALRWLAKGEPAGESFLHTVYGPDGETVERQAPEAGVEVVLDNGITVRKTRKGGKTKYWVLPLYDEPFEKAEVPEAVKEALGIKSSTFGDFEADLNFAYQLAAPFLISEPGSAGAKVLGKLAGTEAIDGAIKATAKDTYAARNDKAAADREYERKIEQLKEYENLDEVQRQLDACEWLLQEIDDAIDRKEDLTLALSQLETAKMALAIADSKLDKLAVIPQLETDLADIEKAQQRYDRLLDLYESLGKATATVETLTQRLADLAGLDACEWLLQEIITAESRRFELNVLTQEYNKHLHEVNRAKGIIEATKDLDTIIDQVAAIEATLERLTHIRALRDAYEAAQVQVTRHERLIASLAGIAEAEALVGRAEANQGLLGRLREVYQQYTVKTRTLEAAEERASIARKDLSAAEADLAAAWEAAGGICPLCEQAVVHAH